MLDYRAIRIGNVVWSANLGANVHVVGTSFPIGTTVDEINRGVVTPEFVMLSSDGKAWIDGWHKPEHGPESDEAVYVERHTVGGCQFHGFADKVSRRIVQAG